MMQCYGQLKRHRLRAGTGGFCLETRPVLPSSSVDNGGTLVGPWWDVAGLVQPEEEKAERGPNKCL